ncbi:MAG: nucleoside kinase [Anaerolineales bacterium]|nr:MAG: nucleoside kinase [Anaerolineales bacterium]
MDAGSIVRPARPRRKAQVRFADGRIYEAPVGTSLETYIQAIDFDLPAPIVAAHINGELREITYHIVTDSEVTPITIADSDGMRIYRRSLAFLMITAAEELFPDAQVEIEYALNFGGFYCEVKGRTPFTPEELARIETSMRQLVDADIPIGKQRVPLEEALSYFEARQHTDKIRLLKTRKKGYLTLYTLNNAKDYYHGYMVPSTGYLQKFALRPHGPGFVLQYPRRELPTVIQEPVEYPKLVAVFNEYGEWMEVMGIPNVGSLNEANEAGRMREVILVSEALHEQRLARIASDIAEQHPRVRLVLIAGPSSSGKTTFSKRLSIQLLAHGIRPTTLALDDFLVNREDTPTDENGDYDFESLYALDLTTFNNVLLRLMDGQEVTLPRYNFITGLRETGESLRISQDHVIIVEGIHGMNPELVQEIHPGLIYRVYVSALTQLNIDQHNRVPTTDTRLLRRIVRDATYRGYSASDTIKRWESVRRGEKRWIFPFQEHADVMFNSALVYELAVLKPFAEPLLLQVKPRTPEHIETKRLLSFLDWFIAATPDLIPDNSILREFIGGSILRDYVP